MPVTRLPLEWRWRMFPHIAPDASLRRWIGFSEDDGKNRREVANIRATKQHLFPNALRTNAFHIERLGVNAVAPKAFGGCPQRIFVGNLHTLCAEDSAHYSPDIPCRLWLRHSSRSV